MHHRSPESSVHGILQARILEWVALPFSRGSSLLGTRELQPLRLNRLESEKAPVQAVHRRPALSTVLLPTLPAPGCGQSGLLWGASYRRTGHCSVQGDARPEGGITVLLSGRMGELPTRASCLSPVSLVPTHRLSLGPSSGP